MFGISLIVRTMKEAEEQGRFGPRRLCSDLKELVSKEELLLESWKTMAGWANVRSDFTTLWAATPDKEEVYSAAIASIIIKFTEKFTALFPRVFEEGTLAHFTTLQAMGEQLRTVRSIVKYHKLTIDAVGEQSITTAIEMLRDLLERAPLDPVEPSDIPPQSPSGSGGASASQEQEQDEIKTATCEMNHKFAYLVGSHPMRDGKPRCPQCLLHSVEIVQSRHNSLQQQYNDLLKQHQQGNGEQTQERELHAIHRNQQRRGRDNSNNAGNL